MNDPLIILKAQGLQKTFSRPANIQILKGVDLEVMRGDTVAIMGRSGEGKSTLLHILGTLESPSSGTLQISNQTIHRFNKSKIRNRHISFIFQSFHLLEDYSALENVLMPARVGRRPTAKGTELYQKGIALLEKVGLGDRIHFSAKLLSGGEKQRVAIARALLNNPDIIFADEPSGNLDRQTARMIHELLMGFCKDEGKTLIVVTHDQELAQLCSKQFRLKEGVLIQENLKGD
jgi:lipoprotein-releasing system ATP-binding protein